MIALYIVSGCRDKNPRWAFARADEIKRRRDLGRLSCRVLGFSLCGPLSSMENYTATISFESTVMMCNFFLKSWGSKVLAWQLLDDGPYIDACLSGIFSSFERISLLLS